MLQWKKWAIFLEKIFHALGLKFKIILNLELRMERQRQTDRQILREIETETEKELHLKILYENYTPKH